MKKLYFTTEQYKKAKSEWNRKYYVKNLEKLKKKRLEKIKTLNKSK